MKDLYFEPLSEKEMEWVDRLRKEFHKKFRSTPPEGVVVKYLGKDFIVYPNVFYPHGDSAPLVENFIINKKDVVLDVATGSGVIAVFAAYKGAKKVVALDINPAAIKTTKENARRHGFKNIIEARLSNGFDNVHKNEMFDVITGNFPFTERIAKDFAEITTYDPDFQVNRDFFENAPKHLKENGRIYLSQANFGNINDVIALARDEGFNVKLIGENDLPNDPRIFYAFEFKRK